MPKSASKTKSAPPSPPKKALTAFFLYRQEVYDDVKSENPDARITKLTEIIGEMWRGLTDEEKKKYDKMYQKNKAKYEVDIAAYEKKYGKVEPKKTKKSKRKTAEE